VVHNIDDPAGRVLALAEIARVLRPGGYLVLADIALHAEYTARLAELGFVGIRHEVSPHWDRLRAVVSFSSFRPGTVVAQKPATTP
jgi:SAM-dependent methyltransferase